MELGPTTLGVLLLVAVALSLLAILLSLVAVAGQRRVRAAYRAFGSGKSGPREDVLAVLQHHVDEVRGLRDDVRDVRRYGEGLREMLGECVSRVWTVRYDAFDDMGGRMSFSSALLDEHGDGVVITSINGRTETRSYAKPIRNGTSRHNLSDEEHHVIERALAEAGRGGEDDLRGPGSNGLPPAAAARVVRDAS
ncbi:MAG: DUF4446 family protein [Egibacteraceae bacterium]